MAESLLVKTALSADGRYYATGADGPFARVFDVNSNSVVAHIDLLDIVHRGRMSALPNMLDHNQSTHDKQAAVASLRSVKLTAIKVSAGASGKTSAQEHSHICVCGFTNGTVVGLRIEDNQVLYHAPASDVQHTVAAISIPEGAAFRGKYVVVLLSDATVAILDLLTGARIVDRIPVPAGTQGIYAAPKPDTPDSLDVLLCGTTSVRCSIHVPSHTAGIRMDLTSTFGGSGGAAAIISDKAATLSRANVFCWLGGPANDIAVTCAASEGTIRVWSLTGKGGRCVRVLPSNSRVVSLSVDVATHATIASTTIAGAILLWRFPSGLVGPTSDATPRPPHLCLTSTVKTVSTRKKNRGISYVQTSKVLQCALSAPQSGAVCVATIVRGKFAMPQFDGTPLPPLFAKGLADAAPALSAGSEMAPDRTLYLRGSSDFNGASDSALPSSVTTNPLETIFTANSSDDEIEDERPAPGWATHKADSHRFYTAAMGEFPAPNIYHAASVKQLPMGDSKEGRQFVKAMQAGEELPSHSEGIAVVPLYQALHANDRSSVLEIITAVSRSEKGMVAVVRALELPYALQLLNILTERLVGLQQMDHPFHLWVRTLLLERGAEMLELETSGEPTKGSMPSVFVAPLLASYQSMLGLRERLAVCWGRLSSVKAIRPRAPQTRKSHATVLHGTVGADEANFPLLFKESIVKHSSRKMAPANKALTTADNSSYKIISVRRKASTRESTAERRENLVAARKLKEKKRQGDAEAEDDGDDMIGIPGASDEDEDDMDQFDGMDLGSSDDEEDVSVSDGEMIAEDSDAGSISAHSSAGDAENLLDSEEDLALDEEAEEEDDEEDDEDDEEDDDGSDLDYDEEGMEYDESDEEDGSEGGHLRAD